MAGIVTEHRYIDTQKSPEKMNVEKYEMFMHTHGDKNSPAVLMLHVKRKR